MADAAEAEILALWSSGKLRAACDASTRAMAALAHPFRDRGGDGESLYHVLNALEDTEAAAALERVLEAINIEHRER